MKSDSLYMATASSDTFLDYYKPIDIPLNDETDYIITISPAYHNKPGKLAYDLYGNANYRWVFRYFNNNKINDPIFDLIEGMSIIVPTKERLTRYI